LLCSLASGALVMCLGLWIISGFGGRLRSEPYQRRHYAIMRWFLDVLFHSAQRVFGLRVAVTEPALNDTEAAARLARPVIVLSRHAGPGDSFLLVRQLDPGLDVVGNRLPNVFVSHRRSGESLFTEQISRLARGLGPAGALVIFPDGGNWTPGRWRRGIRRLDQAGRQSRGAEPGRGCCYPGAGRLPDRRQETHQPAGRLPA
jgi:hypothetical protein